MNLESIAIPQVFVTFGVGIGVITAYADLIQQYGIKSLAPIAITTGLSIINEINFSKKIKKINGQGFLDGLVAFDQNFAHNDHCDFSP